MKQTIFTYYVATDVKNPNFQSVNLEDFNGSIENALIDIKETYDGDNAILLMLDKNGYITTNVLHVNNIIGCVRVPKELGSYEQLIRRDLKIINAVWKVK